MPQVDNADPKALRDDLRAYVLEHLRDAASGLLIIDETSFVLFPHFETGPGSSAHCVKRGWTGLARQSVGRYYRRKGDLDHES
jgi:hypothetical protein